MSLVCVKFGGPNFLRRGVCNTPGPVTGARLFSGILYLIFLIFLRIIGTHSLMEEFEWDLCWLYHRLLVMLGIGLACEKEIIKIRERTLGRILTSSFYILIDPKPLSSHSLSFPLSFPSSQSLV